MAKTFVGKNVERGVDTITIPINEETAKLNKMNQMLKRAKKPGMEWSISVRDLELMTELLAISKIVLTALDPRKVTKLITVARKAIGMAKSGLEKAKQAAMATPVLNLAVVLSTVKSKAQEYIDDGEISIDTIAIPALRGSGAEISNSKGLMKENAVLIEDVKSIKVTGVDPKQALLELKWTKALREGNVVTFYLESGENKEFVNEVPQRYQSVLEEAKVTGQLSKVQGDEDVKIQNRLTAEIENLQLFANLQSDYNEYYVMINKIKSLTEDRDGYKEDDETLYAADIEELNIEIRDFKDRKDAIGSKLLETRKTYKDNSTTLKSIGADNSSTGMLNSREVMSLSSAQKTSLSNEVESAMFIARTFSQNLQMNVVFMDKSESRYVKSEFQIMWDLTKDNKGMYKLLIVLENRQA
jgi:hypothetical protein